MRKIITLFVIALSFLCSNAQETWKAVKVFELNIDSVYGMYIDTVGTTNGDVFFCFYKRINSSQTSIIKTDINGNVIDVIDEIPSVDLTVFTIYNGDTIYITNYTAMIINATNGDTIDGPTTSSFPEFIAASSSNVYCFYRHIGAKKNLSHVYNLFNHNAIYETYKDLTGLYCSGGVVYILEPGLLTYIFENLSYRKQVKISGKFNSLGVYKNSIYTFSPTDKAVYRLEPSDETAVYSVIETDNMKEPVHYSLDGRITDPSTPGMHIVKYPDGSVSKIIVIH